TNCAAFTYEVYYQTLGYKLPDNMYTTSKLASQSAGNGTQVYVYNRTKGSTQTEAEKEKVREEFLGCLQPGDILCIRREDNSGHALLYIGNGEILHSSGSTYNYTGSYGVETYEASIRRVRVEDYFFNPEMTARGDIFSVATKLLVVRPLQVYTGGITETTENRLENLEGIVAEKLSSHVRAQTADIGESITFTYAMHNITDRDVTLKVQETVPEELEWVSGGIRSGAQLSWTVKVPAHGRASVSYTAKVKSGTAYGTLIQSTDSTVGGVTVKCEPVRVGKKLTTQQQEALVDAFLTIKEQGTDLKGLSLVNELYKRATGVEKIFASTSFSTVTRGANGCFKVYDDSGSKVIYQLNPTGSYANMLAPGMYGGYRLWASEFANDRTRLGKEQDLQIGDVLFGKTSSSEGIMLYLGEDLGFVNMSTLADDTVSVAARLERLLAYGYYYAIMRPMQALEN
ncbi:MAG: C40 family peptidase, partial [Oscillospiraceae bacterium]|nr:C40 family peptidase [Oscillospiraceae bacterium]